MTYGAFTAQDFEAYEPVAARARPPVSQAVLCAASLVLSASAGLWLLYAVPESPTPESVASASVSPIVAAPLAAKPQASLQARPAGMVSLRREAALLDPTVTAPNAIAGANPMTFARSAPLRVGFARPAPDVVADIAPAPDTEPQTESAAAPAIVPALPAVSELVSDVPLPTPRPAFLLPKQTPAPASGRRLALQAAAPETPVAPPLSTSPAQPTFFDRMFKPQPQGTALAYAAPDDGGLGVGAARTAPDRYTAVYDIAAHTVTLPDGTRLEAHSGIGPNKDNPRGVSLHMRGATPPAIYDLTSREALFHGVRALRLNPVGGIPYGRMGLLAHTYMLGPHGDSNGCVVFRDFAAFRRAYDDGRIRRLVVVAGI